MTDEFIRQANLYDLLAVCQEEERCAQFLKPGYIPYKDFNEFLKAGFLDDSGIRQVLMAYGVIEVAATASILPHELPESIYEKLMRGFSHIPGSTSSLPIITSLILRVKHKRPSRLEAEPQPAIFSRFLTLARANSVDEEMSEFLRFLLSIYIKNDSESHSILDYLVNPSGCANRMLTDHKLASIVEGAGKFLRFAEELHTILQTNWEKSANTCRAILEYYEPLFFRVKIANSQYQKIIEAFREWQREETDSYFRFIAMKDLQTCDSAVSYLLDRAEKSPFFQRFRLEFLADTAPQGRAAKRAPTEE